MAMTKAQIRAWLLDYAWLDEPEAAKAANVDSIMAQEDYEFVDVVADQFAGAQETGGGPAEFAAGMEFALSALYECHEGPHLPTCPRNEE